MGVTHAAACRGFVVRLSTSGYIRLRSNQIQSRILIIWVYFVSVRLTAVVQRDVQLTALYFRAGPSAEVSWAAQRGPKGGCSRRRAAAGGEVRRAHRVRVAESERACEHGAPLVLSAGTASKIPSQARTGVTRRRDRRHERACALSVG